MRPAPAVDPMLAAVAGFIAIDGLVCVVLGIAFAWATGGVSALIMLPIAAILLAASWSVWQASGEVA